MNMQVRVGINGNFSDVALLRICELVFHAKIECSAGGGPESGAEQNGRGVQYTCILPALAYITVAYGK